jgi:photosynthetic reaction center cytochrome c subunit
MRFALYQVTRGGLGAIACLAVIAPLAAQTAQSEKPLLAEQVFKNVQVLKGIPVSQFMDTMGFFSAALGLNCTGCHVAESLQDLDKFAEDIPRKRTARRMVTMVQEMNKANFGGRRALTCYTCHRGNPGPEVMPSLTEQYSVPPEDPDRIEIAPDGPKEPTADQILEKYIGALGGLPRLASLTSFIAKGTIEGYDTYHVKVPVEIYAKAPNQRTMVYHTQNGDSTTVFDGQKGWLAAVDRPLPLLSLLPGAEQDSAKFDAELCFPGGIKRALNQWKVGFPVTAIDDQEVNVIQGTGGGGSRFKLYFNAKTGLLMRQLRYAETPVGMVPTQVDYSDYREVAGVRMPFKMVVTWTDGQSIILLTDVQPNAAIDASRFAKPAPAVLKPKGGAR